MQFFHLYSFLLQLWAASCACWRRTASRSYLEHPKHLHTHLPMFLILLVACKNALCRLMVYSLSLMPYCSDFHMEPASKQILLSNEFWHVLGSFCTIFYLWMSFFPSIAEGLHLISIKGIESNLPQKFVKKLFACENFTAYIMHVSNKCVLNWSIRRARIGTLSVCVCLCVCVC